MTFRLMRDQAGLATTALALPHRVQRCVRCGPALVPLWSEGSSCFIAGYKLDSMRLEGLILYRSYTLPRLSSLTQLDDLLPSRVDEDARLRQ